MPKQKSLLRRRTRPQWVWLPNGQSFLARYEGVSSRNLLRNMAITRTRQIGPRNQRKQMQWSGSLFGTIVKLGTKVLTPTGILKKRAEFWCQGIKYRDRKKLVKKGIKHMPEVCRLGTSKFKNQSMKKALESGAAN